MDVGEGFKDNRLLKGLVVVLVLMFVFMLIKYAQVKNDNKSLEAAYEEKLQKEISQKELLIETYLLEIETSKNTIISLKNQRVQYKHSLDSLSAVKQRIRTIYKEKIVEIETFNSIEIENYWKNKFKIDE